VRLGPGLHHACSHGSLGLKRASRSKTCKHQVAVVALQSKLWLKRVWRFQDGFTHLTEDPSVLALAAQAACTALACRAVSMSPDSEPLHSIKLAGHLLS